MDKKLQLGQKVRVLGHEATVLRCSGHQVLIHTTKKNVLWIDLSVIESLASAN